MLSRFLVLMLFIGAVPPAWAQQESSESQPESTLPADSQQPGAEPVERKTDAERIVDLKSAIEKTEKQLAELREELQSPQGELADAEAQFTELDRQRNEKNEALEKARADQDAQRTAALEGELKQLQPRWELAKERFDLALQEQTARRDQIQTLEKKLQQDRDALQQLQAPPVAPTATQPAAADQSATPTTPPEPEQQQQQQQQPAAPPAQQQPAAQPGAATQQTAPAAPAAGEEPASPELKQAKQAAEKKQAEAARAEAAVQSISDRIATLQSQIETESKLLETAQKKARVAREQQDTLEQQIRTQTQAGAPQDKLQELRDVLATAEARASEARTEISKRRESIDQLQSDLIDLQVEQIAALGEAKAKRGEAEAASEKVEKLENPFSTHNLLRWLIDHGPRLLGIIVGAFVLLWVTRIIEHRLVRVLVGGRDHGSRAERENRANTLASVFRNVSYIVIIVGAILMVLTEVGVAIAPLLGGAAVVGLAIAFGAQSLVKDYFYGFIILLENQYTINDVVKIGDTAGLVERITLRMTVLRDLEGVVHFVPHGEATRVSNLTHGWSRTVLDIGVSYNEDADHVMKVLAEIGQQLYQDPEFRPLMLSEPEILGLDALADSAIVIKLMVKTRPLQQWTIKREYLRRIKHRFDELGIEIPFPHRTVYLRWEQNQRLTVRRDDSEMAADPHHPDDLEPLA